MKECSGNSPAAANGPTIKLMTANMNNSDRGIGAYLFGWMTNPGVDIYHEAHFVSDDRGCVRRGFRNSYFDFKEEDVGANGPEINQRSRKEIPPGVEPGQAKEGPM